VRRYVFCGHVAAVAVLAFVSGCDLSVAGDAPFPLTGSGGVTGASDAGFSLGGTGTTSSAISDASVVDAGSVGPVALDAGSAAAAARDASTAPDAAADDTQDASIIPAAIGAWGFDEGSGASSADLSGHGHAAALVGGATWGTGKVGGGLELDGLTGFADVGVALVDTTASFSVVAWAQFYEANAWEVTTSQDGVNGSLFALKLRGDATDTFDFDAETSDFLTPGFIVAQSSSKLTVEEWVHLAGVYDASGSGTLKVYVNGSLETTTPVAQHLPTGTGHFILGRGLYNEVRGSYLRGVLDEVAAYDVALTDAQVAAIYTE
jgi:hypothetical protein